MTIHNWKFVQTPTGKLTYALCIKDKAIREIDDIGLACAIEQSGNYEIENSINDFLADSKAYFEEKQRGGSPEYKIKRIPSSQFRSDQNRIKKEEEKLRVKKLNKGD
ncbi:hypothetical protein KAR91_46715 [Candidatus Pacearchaeota archaeon]|nr:hypothetical protein [Candidatus Pacearchaeota archaeon]